MSFERAELLCTACFARLSVQGRRCPSCGHDDNNYLGVPFDLPPRTILRDRYLVGIAHDENDTFITYVGYDLLNSAKVYIHEYYPDGLAQRDEGISNTVQAIAGDSSHLFEPRRDRLLKGRPWPEGIERLPGDPQIDEIFAENNTVYFISKHVEEQNDNAHSSDSHSPGDAVYDDKDGFLPAELLNKDGEYDPEWMRDPELTRKWETAANVLKWVKRIAYFVVVPGIIITLILTVASQFVDLSQFFGEMQIGRQAEDTFKAGGTPVDPADIPNCEGMTYKAVISELDHFAYVIEFEARHSDEVPGGIVIEQSYSEPERTLTLVFSAGPEPGIDEPPIPVILGFGFEADRWAFSSFTDGSSLDMVVRYILPKVHGNGEYYSLLWCSPYIETSDTQHDYYSFPAEAYSTDEPRMVAINLTVSAPLSYFPIAPGWDGFALGEKGTLAFALSTHDSSQTVTDFSEIPEAQITHFDREIIFSSNERDFLTGARVESVTTSSDSDLVFTEYILSGDFLPIFQFTAYLTSYEEYPSSLSALFHADTATWIPVGNNTVKTITTQGTGTLKSVAIVHRFQILKPDPFGNVYVILFYDTVDIRP